MTLSELHAECCRLVDEWWDDKPYVCTHIELHRHGTGNSRVVITVYCSKGGTGSKEAATIEEALALFIATWRPDSFAPPLTDSQVDLFTANALETER